MADNHFTPYGFITPTSVPAGATQVTATYNRHYLMHFKADINNSGRIYICDDPTLAVKATGAHIITYLEAGEAWDWISYERHERTIQATAVYLFSDNGTDKVLVTGHKAP